MDTTVSQPRIALLIDFDNVYLGVDDPPGFDIELVVNALRLRGVVVLGRAYGDWYRHSRHRRKLMEQGIELVETPAFGPIIKNAADIRIALDGLEIGMTQHHITEFCLVSGDSDFLPLIKKLQYLGKTVVVISGNKFTADLVRRNCNEFISYENLLAESVGALEDATVLEGAFSLLSRTIISLHERGMEVRSSTVKQMMLQLNPVFSERNFGCSQFKQFLDKGCRANIIKLGRRDPNSGEYTVLLPSDFDDVPTEEPRAVEPVKPAPRSRRRVAPPKVQASGEDLGLHDISNAENNVEAESDDAASTTESGEVAANGEGAAGRALRRGRLRFSGKTWKGGSRSVLQAGQNGEASNGEGEADQVELIQTDNVPSLENSDASQGESTPVAPESENAETAPVEAAAEEAAVEEKGARKRGARGGRRRKTATPADGETSETASEKAVEAVAEPVVEAIVETPVEAAAEPEVEGEKAAAKKPVRRRRAPAKKKAE